MKKITNRIITLILVLAVCAILYAIISDWKENNEICREYEEANDVLDLQNFAKPVIYLYPQKETEVSVNLNLNGMITCAYPTYREGWRVTARPDGILTDCNGRCYEYLYWEGVGDYEPDFTRGWCVKGSELVPFFEKTLSALGLSDSEANEFIVYWLSVLQENAYNLISFDAESYCENAVLTVSPAPDTVIRVFMTCKAVEEPVDIPAPELPTPPERNGFTLLEWGGTIVK